MKLGNALRLYAVRVRARLAHECLAVLGIAAGVALLFASQISNSSLQGSVGRLARGIDGNAALQLVARDSHGFPQSALARVRRLTGVLVAAPLLEAQANAVGPRGSASVLLVGADENLTALRGALVRDSSLAPFGGIGAIVLPAPLGQTIGVTKFGQEATLQVSGRSVQVPLYALLSPRRIGALASTPVALAPLSYVQEATGLAGRLSRILVQTAPGARRRVTAALARIAGSADSVRADVEPAGYDQRLFAQAATASSQSTALFSAVSALVGFLFAFNATLLTVPQRRRLVVDLRRDGYSPATAISALLLDALGLGTLGCMLGLALGDELSIHLFHSEPAFLSLAFAVGSQRVVSAHSMIVAVAGGMGAATVAVLSPLRDIVGRDRSATLAALAPHQRAPRPGTGGASGAIERATAAGARLSLVGLACLAGATALLLHAPQTPLPATALLVGALLLQLPLALHAALVLLGGVSSLVASPVGHLARMELTAAGPRAIAIAATGAVAVLGSVTISGAHDDLLSGLDAAARRSSNIADAWVAPAGSYDLLHTSPFVPRQGTALARLPGVRAVSPYRGGLLDYGARRVRVLAPPASSLPPLLAGQLLSGDTQMAEARLRAGGWIAISRGLAQAHGLRLGDAVTLPTPRPTQLHVAAIATNLGWAPGAIAMSAEDYARAWDSADVSAYAVSLYPGFSRQRALTELRRALPAGSGLAVQSAQQQATAQDALSRQALARLTQIAGLVPIVAVLAMAAAIGALVWQRRPRLAKLRIEGIARAELWRTTLLESVVLLGVGCLTGAAFGLYGQQLADRALSQAIDFPIAPSLAASAALASVALVVGTALAVLALPGWLASSVPAALALQD